MKAESIYNPSTLHINYSVLSGDIFVTVISVILFAMVVSALAMCVCSFAKTFKEAQNYITPLMLIIMVLLMGIMNSSIDKMTSETITLGLS